MLESVQNSINNDLALFWMPILIGIISFLIMGICLRLRPGGDKYKGDIKKICRIFVAEFIRNPFGGVKALCGATAFLWMAGMAFSSFVMWLWLIHVQLKSDLIEWIFSFLD